MDGLPQKLVAYFDEQFTAYLANAFNNLVTPDNQYRNICNFIRY